MEAFFAQDVVDEHLDEAYVDGTRDPRQHLDLFVPRGLASYPVVVFIHGGFWIHQSKDFFQPVVGLYRNVGIALARRGIATAVIEVGERVGTLPALPGMSPACSISSTRSARQRCSRSTSRM